MSRRRLIAGFVFAGIIILIGAVLDTSAGCRTHTRVHTVDGSSVSGLFEHRQEITAQHDYYKCFPVRRGDVVLVNQASSKRPLIKVVKAIPGDQWRMITTDAGTQLEVNGEVVRNSLGIAYLFRNKTVLSLYEQDSGGSIPADSFIILGNLASGTQDSTRFGFVHQSDLLARVDSEGQGD